MKNPYVVPPFSANICDCGRNFRIRALRKLDKDSPPIPLDKATSPA